MPPRAGSKRLIREINEALVLDVVRSRAPVARGEVAARTGLSPATITGITGQLLGLGLLTETEEVRTGGRPARLLELGTETVRAVGLRLAPGTLHLDLVDLRGRVITSQRRDLPDTAPTTVLDAAAELVAPHSSPDGPRLLGVGVALAGNVDAARGIVRHSAALGWEDVDLGPRLEQRLGVPVVLDSYVNALTQGLLLFDDPLEHRDLLIVSLGTSLGASVVIDGRLHRGASGAGGGFAHAAAPADGDRPCHCGARGCLETWSSRWGIDAELARRGLGPEAVDDPDTDVVAVLEDAGTQLGLAVAAAAKLLAPDQVLLAVAPELDLPTFVQRVETVVAEQYARSTTPAPDVHLLPPHRATPQPPAPVEGPTQRPEPVEGQPVERDHSGLARGAAAAVLQRLFTASLQTPPSARLSSPGSS